MQCTFHQSSAGSYLTWLTLNQAANNKCCGSDQPNPLAVTCLREDAEGLWAVKGGLPGRVQASGDIAVGAVSQAPGLLVNSASECLWCRGLGPKVDSQSG